MKGCIAVLFLAISSTLLCNFESHLKPALDKGQYHTMRNIDFIYMINLDQRPEKFQKSQTQLNPYGVYPYRFSAVNGWELCLEVINDIGVKYQRGMKKGVKSTFYPLEENLKPHYEYACREGQNYFCNGMSRGAIGIILSHLSVLQDAYDSGYETIWVMEDDVEVKRDPQIIPLLIDELDQVVGSDNWDILFTDRDTKDRQGNHIFCYGYGERLNFIPAKTSFEIKTINSNLRKIVTRYGAYSLIIRRNGIKKILDFYKAYDVFLAYDMDIFLAPGIQLYTVLEDVVTTRINAESDNQVPGYIHK